MGEQLAIPGSPLALVGTMRAPRRAPDSAWLARYLEAVDRAEARIDSPHSDATMRAYRATWRRWGVHCSALQIDPLPVRPGALVAYLEMYAAETTRSGRLRAPNSVRLELAALCSLDQAHRAELGDDSPAKLRRAPRVARWLSSWSRRQDSSGEVKAPALTVAQIDQILYVAAEPRRNLGSAQHVALYTRDRAIILLGLCAARRVSELAALTLRDVELTERGLLVHVRRSKTDQRGKGLDVAVMPQGRAARCAVEAHRAWLQLRGDAPGPLYPAITRSGGLELGRALTVRQLQLMIAGRARAAGVVCSSHSLRATFATLAVARGRPLPRIADQGGWGSLDVLRGYVRQRDLFDDNASSGLLE